MHWLVKGLIAGLLLFVAWQGWHLFSGHPISTGSLAADLAQWLFAGFGIGVFLRARGIAGAEQSDEAGQ